jgi:pyruvate,orthophosphate dikinase
VRSETSPEDIRACTPPEAFYAAAAFSLIAAVIARGMGKTCVVGASGLRIDYEAEP